MAHKQKIAQCSNKGNFIVSPEIFENDDWDFELKLFSTSNQRDWYKMKLAYAEYCIQRGDEREAFDIYTCILEKVISNSKIDEKYKDIAFNAYDGLSKVTWSGSEYIWESGISVIDEYRPLFEKN